MRNDQLRLRDIDEAAQYIYLTGINHPERVDTYFVSHMVDLACVVEMSNGLVKVAPEEEIDLRNPNDAEWLIEIVTQALAECNEVQAKIEIRT